MAKAKDSEKIYATIVANNGSLRINIPKRIAEIKGWKVGQTVQAIISRQEVEQ